VNDEPEHVELSGLPVERKRRLTGVPKASPEFVPTVKVSPHMPRKLAVARAWPLSTVTDDAIDPN